ncbi:uncharacterized protein [Dendropsophus ebraccatus]|uniref:uncharacterized protein n=1 Tax=Dendropsophus ebraccatus TaxID=150705 RepID=UPI003832013E
MTSLTGILSLLSALIATSDALSCIECRSFTSWTCSDNSVICPPKQVCTSVYTAFTFDKERLPGVLRTFTDPSNCDFKGSMSFGYGRFRMVILCCDTDDCSPPVPPLPTPSYIPNGLICESSASHDSIQLFPPGNIQCTGDEDMCIHHTGHQTEPYSSTETVQGCATKSLCDLSGPLINILGLATEVKNICTSDRIRTDQSPAVHENHQEL